MKQVELWVEEGPNGKRIFLGPEYPDIYLTLRESELAQLLEEFKYREIAELLSVSRRTIEYYTMNMKKKLRCRNKRELVYVIRHSGLLEQLKELVDVSYLFKAQENAANDGMNKNKDTNNNKHIKDETSSANHDHVSQIDLKQAELTALIEELIAKEAELSGEIHDTVE